MDHVQLGRRGPKVSAIGLGAWQAGMKGWGSDYSIEDVERAITTAIDGGINFFDIAEIYGTGRSEEVLGRVLQERRDELVIATKVAPWNLSRRRLRRALDNSLGRLGLDYVDLYQIHIPPSYYVSINRTMRDLESLVKEGKVHHIGVSNFPTRLLQAACSGLSTTEVISNQVEYNLLCRWVEKDLLPYCQREGIALIAYSPLAQGMLTGKYSREKLPKGGARRYNRLFKPKTLTEIQPLLGVLKMIGESKGKTMAQVSLNWLICRGAVPIPGAKRPEQVKENMGACDWRLSEKEMQNIEEAAMRVGVEKGSYFGSIGLFRLLPSSLIRIFVAGRRGRGSNNSRQGRHEQA